MPTRGPSTVLRTPAAWPPHPLLLLLLSVCVGPLGCAGGMHRRGDRAVGVAVHYGIPLTAEVADLVGHGRARNIGVTVDGQWFVRDRVALLARVSPLLVYDQSDGTVYGGEVAFGPRWHFWSRGRVGLFGDVLGGVMVSSRSIPEEGTARNWTLAFGPGLEIALRPSLHLHLGYRFRHVSNGRGRVADNPSQNDHHAWLGLALDW